ncbi:molybdenum cofactor biosynthesis moeA family protein [Mycobacterium ulcerans str. Harvey]|uniref:Molybdopterin molybdenumtransferase n=1 Tax=Mycobacterium ulcerans str. Harvey TaxID=1299332 RepID=A0ABN0R3C0_MYCUL|nr:molybdenum cofactor biosynthesis moeA family protein [Mycobacterium ulcerans str. Harvey]
MRSVEEHQRVVTNMVRARPVAKVPLQQAQGLVLADDVVAPLPLPVFDNSAMDGYAVRAEDTVGASAQHPVVLPVAEDIPAGRVDQLRLHPGTAHRIMTGRRYPPARRRSCRWKPPTGPRDGTDRPARCRGQAHPARG